MRALFEPQLMPRLVAQIAGYSPADIVGGVLHGELAQLTGDRGEAERVVDGRHGRFDDLYGNSSVRTSSSSRSTRSRRTPARFTASLVTNRRAAVTRARELGLL